MKEVTGRATGHSYNSGVDPPVYDKLEYVILPRFYGKLDGFPEIRPCHR